MAKFIQKENLYENNEFLNMPSIWNRGEDLTTKSTKKVNWEKVDEIVKKYNFRYTTINDTFCYFGERGVFQSEFILYFKPLIDEDWYQEHLKNKDYEPICKWLKIESSICKLLHACVHELDEETELYFDTGWAGNVGLFGSHDVKRKTYSFGDTFTSWADITNFWSPLTHDTNKKLEKGVYILMTSRFLKGGV